MDDFINEGEIEEEKKSPLIYILAVFLLLLIALMVVPYYGIKSDPNPEYVPNLEEVLKGLNIENATRLDSIYSVNGVEISPFLKAVSSRIAGSCDSDSRVCYSKAFFYFVRDEINYITDPNFEYIESAELVLESGAADCDGESVLLSLLLKSVGVPNRIVIGNNHAYVQAYLPDALKSYKTEGDWVSLDPSCRNCEFGDLNSMYLKNIDDFVYVN